MNVDDFANLKEGDIVRHKLGNDGYTVIGRFGNRVIAMRVVDLSNPVEWHVAMKRPNFVAVTKPAVDYLIHETGLEPDAARELLQSVLVLSQVK